MMTNKHIPISIINNFILCLLICCSPSLFVHSQHTYSNFQDLSTLNNSSYHLPEDATEIVAKRSLNQRVYKAKDGRIIYHSSYTPLNYKNIQDEWTPVDIRLRPFENGGYIADQQQYPIGLTEDGHIFIRDQEKTLYSISTERFFGLKTTHPYYSKGESPKPINDFSLEFNIHPLITERIDFKQNSVKLDYIIQSSIDTNDYQIKQQLYCPPTFELKAHPSIDGALILHNEKNQEMGVLHPIFCYDKKNHSSFGKYHFFKNELGYSIILELDKDWFEDKSRSYPIVVDPLIVGPTEVWSNGYNIPSCGAPNYSTDSLKFTIPGNTTVTGFYVSGSYYANPNSSATKSQGKMFFSTNNCGQTVTLTVGGASGNQPGDAYLSNFDFLDPLLCCVGQSCVDRDYYLRMHITRTVQGSGCNSDHVYHDPSRGYPFSCFLEARTIEADNSSWNVSPSTLCSDKCNLVLTTDVQYGVPPYTVSHEWSANPVSQGSVNNTCVLYTSTVQLPLTRTNCPTYELTSQSLSVSAPTIKDACGNTVSGLSAKSITINPTPKLSVSSSLDACSPATVDLTAPSVTATSTPPNAILSYWADAACTQVLASPSSISQSGTYFIKSTFGSCEDVKSITVNINPKPNLVVNPPATVCSPNVIDLTATDVTTSSTPSDAVLSYWSDVSCTQALASPSSVSQSGTYYIKSVAGGCEDVKSITVNINPKPNLVINPPSAVCSPATIDLTLSGVTASSTPSSAVLSYWADAACTQVIASPSSISQSGTYYIKSVAGGCEDVKSIDVTITPKPNLVVNSPVVACSPATIDLTAPGVTTTSTPTNAVLSYWTNVSCTQALNTPSSVSQSGSYYIKSVAGDCEDVKSITVNLLPKPNLVINPPAAVCSPNTVDLTASNITAGSSPNVSLSYFSDTLNWTTISDPSAIAISDTFFILSSLNQCTSLAEVTVVVLDKPQVDAGNHLTRCSGDTVTLNATGKGEYTWNKGVLNNTPFIVSQSEVYEVTATFNGCTNNDSVLITVNPLPTVIAGVDDTICSGNPITLNAQGAASYVWDNALSNGVPFTPDLGVHTYTVTGTSTQGCKNKDQVTITVLQKPTVQFSADILSGCVPLTVVFTNNTPNASNCFWSFGDGQTSDYCSKASVTYNQPGCFSVDLDLNADGCNVSLTEQDYICVEKVPDAEFTASRNVISELNAQVQFINLTEGTNTYYWDFGDSTNSTMTDPMHYFAKLIENSVEVTLKATSPSGCSDTSKMTIHIEDDLIFWIPNAFTPDENMLNNEFKPIFYSGFDPLNYTLQIFNRWGQPIFESHDINIGWNGSYGDKEQVSSVQDGLYSWKISVKLGEKDDLIELHGHVNLLK